MKVHVPTRMSAGFESVMKKLLTTKKKNCGFEGRKTKPIALGSRL